MSLSDWHSRFSKALTADRSLRTSAWALVESELESAHEAYRGVVLGCRALLRNQDGPVFALSALADIEEALPLLSEELMERFRVLLVAQSICYEGRLKDRAGRYQELMATLLASSDTDLFANWEGRVLLSQGQYQMLLGNDGEANAILLQAIDWHEKYEGPYGDHDRKCYLALSLLNLGTVQLKLNGPAAAQLFLDRAAREMPADSRRQGVLNELRGLIALTRGDISEARSAGEILLELGGVYAYCGTEILARVALLTKDPNLCLQYVEEGIRLAVAAGDWVRVRTLENLGSRLIHKC